MKLFSVYSADGEFIGNWTALSPEDAITKAKETIQRFLRRPRKEPFVAKLFR
jgi:hypothetical protein